MLKCRNAEMSHSNIDFQHLLRYSARFNNARPRVAARQQASKDSRRLRNAMQCNAFAKHFPTSPSCGVLNGVSRKSQLADSQTCRLLSRLVSPPQFATLASMTAASCRAPTAADKDSDAHLSTRCGRPASIRGDKNEALVCAHNWETTRILLARVRLFWTKRRRRCWRAAFSAVRATKEA